MHIILYLVQEPVEEPGDITAPIPQSHPARDVHNISQGYLTKYV